MKRQNLLPDGFAQGLSTYTDHIPGFEEPHSRIYISVRFGGGMQSVAVLDTGTPYCILDPGEAAALGLDYRACGRLTRAAQSGDFDPIFDATPNCP